MRENRGTPPPILAPNSSNSPPPGGLAVRHLVSPPFFLRDSWSGARFPVVGAAGNEHQDPLIADSI